MQEVDGIDKIDIQNDIKTIERNRKISNNVSTNSDDDSDILKYLDQIETIYTDFEFMNTETDFNVEPKPFSLPWGGYSKKPEIQSQWESAVAA